MTGQQPSRRGKVPSQGSAKYLPFIITLLDKTHPSTADKMSRPIRQITSPDSVVGLIRMSEGSDPDTRAAAVIALRRMLSFLSDTSLRDQVVKALEARSTDDSMASHPLIPKHRASVAHFATYALNTQTESPFPVTRYSARVPSNRYWPNAWARHYFLCYQPEFEKVSADLGLGMVYKILSMTGAIHLGWQAFPPENMDRVIDFCDVANFNWGILKMFGPLAGREVQGRAGLRHYACVEPEVLTHLTLNPEVMSGLANPSAVLVLVLTSLAKVFSQHSDQPAKVRGRDGNVELVLKHCPHCEGLRSVEPCCFPMVGLLKAAALQAHHNPPWEVIETECQGTGGRAYVFQFSLAENG